MPRRFECQCNCEKACIWCGKPRSEPHTAATLAAHERVHEVLFGIDPGPCPEPARWVPLREIEAGLRVLRADYQSRLAVENQRRIAALGDQPAYGLRLVK
jgi:hypothetical protein